MWNSLPYELRKAEDFGEFTRRVHAWGGFSCECSMSKFNLKKLFLVFRFLLFHLCFCFCFASVAFLFVLYFSLLRFCSLHVVALIILVLALQPLKV